MQRPGADRCSGVFHHRDAVASTAGFAGRLSLEGRMCLGQQTAAMPTGRASPLGRAHQKPSAHVASRRAMPHDVLDQLASRVGGAS